MNILLQNVAPSQLPLIEELARVLGFDLIRDAQSTVDEDAFYAQLDQRTVAFEQGTAKTVSLEELAQQARESYSSQTRS